MIAFVIIFAIVILASLIAGAKQVKKTSEVQRTQAEREAKEAVKKTETSSLSSQPSQSSSSLLQPHSHTEQRVVPISSAASVEDKDEARERARRELQARLDEYKAKKAQVEDLKSRADGKMTPRVAPRVAAATTHSHNEAHSDIVFKDHAKYRVEEVPVMNSIGGQSDEGCSEHYNLRYVKLDKPIIPEHLELTELQKCIVYGEIINQPAFKKNYRR